MPHPPRFITASGRTLTLKEWSEESGLAQTTITCRLDRLKWSPERAISAKADKRFRAGGRPRADAPRPCPKLREGQRGEAFVRWLSFSGDCYRSFGAWGSEAAKTGFRRFAAEWASGSYDAPDPTSGGGSSVAALVVAWMEHVNREYRKFGKPTSEFNVCARAGQRLNELYGDEAAAEFTPAKLRAVRQSWISEKKTRHTCNGYTNRVARCFEFGVGRSIIAPAVHQALLAVEGLKAGRTEAPDRPRVQAATDADVAATLAALPDTPRGRLVGAMIRVQRAAGLRPQHITEMRVCDVTRGPDVWRYIPPATANKTLHLGKHTTFFLGAKAQAALLPYLVGKSGTEAVFSYPLGVKQKTIRISRNNFAVAVRVACIAAGVAPWHPHQLRHALATAVAERFQSIAHAAAAIGDNAATAAAVYVHVDPQERSRIEVARAMG